MVAVNKGNMIVGNFFGRKNICDILVANVIKLFTAVITSL